MAAVVQVVISNLLLNLYPLLTITVQSAVAALALLALKVLTA
jgi:hypothetical protein